MTHPLTLSKWIATCGIASRRKATDAIKAGLVTVNGLIKTNPAYRVAPTDVVECDGAAVKKRELVYLILNKPTGYITTTSDELNRRTITSLLPFHYQRIRVFPVGRLDQDTAGLLLLTNDGELAQQLAHPRYQIHKTYRVILARPLTVVDAERIKRGMYLRDGFVKPDRIALEAQSRRFVVLIQLHSGKKRVIRRIFAALKYTVTSLERVNYAGISLGSLAPGAWRLLNEQEITQLRSNKKSAPPPQLIRKPPRNPKRIRRKKDPIKPI